MEKKNGNKIIQWKVIHKYKKDSKEYIALFDNEYDATMFYQRLIKDSMKVSEKIYINLIMIVEIIKF